VSQSGTVGTPLALVTHVPIREFTDSAGVHWQVWSTIPAMGGVAGGFRQGWLTFSSPNERRRLAPIPPNWEVSSDAELRVLVRQAEAAKRTPPSGMPTDGSDDGGL
jgi:hypothetical protein